MRSTSRRNLIFISIIVVVVLLVFVVAIRKKPIDSTTSIRFASLLPLDGQVAAYGEMMRNGQSLAEHDINDNPSNIPLEILFYNTSHKKDIALDRLREAEQQGIKFVVEIFGSDQALHCFDYAREHDMTILSGVDTRPDLVEAGNGIFFRIMPNDAAAAGFITSWAEEMKLKRIAIIYANDDWGKGLLQAAEKNIEKLGLEIVATRDVTRNQPSFSAMVTQLKSPDPQAVFLFIYPDDGGNFLKEAQRQALTSRFFATENFTGTTMVNVAKSAAEGVMIVVPKTDTDNPSLKNFQKQYKKRFDEDPTIFAIKGYDAVYTLYKAEVEAKGDPIKIREKLMNLEWEGISGTIKFNSGGEFVPGEYSRLIFIKEGSTYIPRQWSGE